MTGLVSRIYKRRKPRRGKKISERFEHERILKRSKSKCLSGHAKGETLFSVGRNANHVQSLVKSVWQFLKKFIPGHIPKGLHILL